MSRKSKLGVPAEHRPNQWVQTERRTHEAWARLSLSKPRAAALAHHLVANMGNQNAVVISQRVLADLMGCSVDTVMRAVKDLVAANWIQVVKIGRGRESAYVINDRVAWAQSRKSLNLSTFSANVVADLSDQEDGLLGHGDLMRFPTLLPGEQQIVAGHGLEPPSQQLLDGVEVGTPAKNGEQGM